MQQPPLTSHPRVLCTAPVATVSRPDLEASTVTQGIVMVERQSLTEFTAVAGVSAVPIHDSWRLPQPDTITNNGINIWIKQVIETYSTSNPAALADFCLSIYRNAQFLNDGIMDFLVASCQTYINHCCCLKAQYDKSQSETTKATQELALHMRSCEQRNQRFTEMLKETNQ